MAECELSLAVGFFGGCLVTAFVIAIGFAIIRKEIDP